MINREDIIRMAREAGYQHPDAVGSCEDFAYFDIERFAALVEQDFKERLAQAIEQLPFGDTAQSFATYVRGFK